MKKRISTRAICLLVAVAMLMGALTVSAINGSPYENLKNAVVNALFYENFSMEGEFTFRVDNQLYARERIRTYFGNESRLEISSSETGWRPGDESPIHSNNRMSYTTRYFRINPVFAGGGPVQWYIINNFDVFSSSHDLSSPQPMGYNIFGAAGRNSNYLRLAELAIDLFVGDLKNNLTMSSQADGNRRISGAITESQLPEFVRVIIDIAIDEQLRWRNTDNLSREDFNNVLDVPMRGITIDRIQGNADIDSNGNLLYINVLGIATIESIFGDTYVLELEGNLRFTEIGTTMPDSPFPGAYEIFRGFSGTQASQWSNRQFFFTLDEDGNVDAGSITNQWPQWSMPEMPEICLSSLRENLS